MTNTPSTHHQQCAVAPASRLGKVAVLATAIAAFAAPSAQALVLDTGTLVIAPTGVLDLKNNNLIVRTGNYVTIENYVRTGLYNGVNGFWDGPGVNSSLAASDPDQSSAVGILDNSVAGYTSWPPLEPVSGLTGTEILVKYTYFGDADLDGQVTGSDFLLLNDGFGSGGTDWVFGDFDYDNAVTGSDFLLINAGFAASQSNPPRSPEGALAVVPEPSSILLVVSGFVATLGLRRNRRSNINSQ